MLKHLSMALLNCAIALAFLFLLNALHYATNSFGQSVAAKEGNFINPKKCGSLLLETLPSNICGN